MATNDEIELIIKSRALSQIEEHVDGLDRGHVGPRPGLARILALGAGIWSIAWVFCITETGVEFWGWSIIAFSLVFFLTHKIVHRYSSLPLTVTAQLDALLSNYTPIDVDAFRNLQKKTKELGYMKGEVLREWITQERIAGKNAVEKNRSEPLKFTSKSVDGLGQHTNNVRKLR